MVYGILGLINFAHGDLVMVGALVALTVLQSLFGSTLPVSLAITCATLAAMLVCMTLGVTIERVLPRLLDLELRGLLRRAGGGRFVRI